jgi:hypothetical protein
MWKTTDSESKIEKQERNNCLEKCGGYYKNSSLYSKSSAKKLVKQSSLSP